MKVFRLEFNECDYDQYDSFIVLANSEEDAVSLVEQKYPKDKRYSDVDWKAGYKITEINLGGEAEILLGSFNAG